MIDSSQQATSLANKDQELAKLEVDPVAEQGLEHLYSGKSLREAASEMGCSHTTLVRHFLSNPTYELQYARALMCKGAIYAEEIVQIPDDLPSDPTQGEIAKAKMRMEARQWTGTKFWSKLSPEVQGKSGLAINVGTQTQPLTIQLVSSQPQPSDKPLGDSADVIELNDTETQSQ